MNNYVFVNLKMDTMNIKDASTWSVALCHENEVLYIEPQETRSENIPPEKFHKFVKETYFVGLSEADGVIEGVLENGDKYPINIFTDNPKNTKTKILDFFNKIYEKTKKPIQLVFENPYEYVLFNNSFLGYDDDGVVNNYNIIETIPIILLSVCQLFGNDMEIDGKSYIMLKQEFLNASYDEVIKTKDVEKIALFEKLILTLSTMFMRDYFNMIMNALTYSE